MFDGQSVGQAVVRGLNKCPWGLNIQSIEEICDIFMGEVHWRTCHSAEVHISKHNSKVSYFGDHLPEREQRFG